MGYHKCTGCLRCDHACDKVSVFTNMNAYQNQYRIHAALQVIAIDSNTAQLEAAAIHSRISYKQGFAENTGLCSKSVDLVTASQALHW